MAKLTLGDVSNIGGNPTSAATTLNNNNTLLEAALENTLSRDGTSPNQMTADIDMNNNDLLNVKSLDTESIILDGVPLTPLDELISAYATRLYDKAFVASGSTASFTLDVAPGADEAVLVWVGGAIQNISSYSVSGTTLTLDEIPAASVNVRTLIISQATYNAVLEAALRAEAAAATIPTFGPLATATPAEAMDYISDFDQTTNVWYVNRGGSWSPGSACIDITDFVPSSQTADCTDGFEDAVFEFYKSASPIYFDGRGRNINLSRPIDMSTVATKTVFASVRNFMNCNLVASQDFPDTVVTKFASCTAGSDVMTMADTTGLTRGMHVITTTFSSRGVARETYIKSVDSSTQITLSVPAWRSRTNFSHTFTKYGFMLDFSKWEDLERTRFTNTNFNLGGFASGILLPFTALETEINLCRFGNVKAKGIVDFNQASNALSIGQCNFTSAESTGLPWTEADRVGCAVVCTHNDSKINRIRGLGFLHNIVYHGSGHLLHGYHMFAGEQEGIIFTRNDVKSTITGSYIDNACISLTGEYGGTTDLGGLSIIGNHFTKQANDPDFRWILLKPHAADSTLENLNVVGNVFHCLAGTILRADGVDTTNGSMDASSYKRLHWHSNGYRSVVTPTSNPATVEKELVNADTAVSTMTFDLGDYLPFSGWTKTASVDTMKFRDNSNAQVFDVPYIQVATDLGAGNRTKVQLNFAGTRRGRFRVTADVNSVPTV